MTKTVLVLHFFIDSSVLSLYSKFTKYPQKFLGCGLFEYDLCMYVCLEMSLAASGLCYNYLIVSKVHAAYLCSISIPTTLKRRHTAFSPNVAHYASRRTVLFIAMFGSCDVMPCYLINIQI